MHKAISQVADEAEHHDFISEVHYEEKHTRLFRYDGHTLVLAEHPQLAGSWVAYILDEETRIVAYQTGQGLEELEFLAYGWASKEI